jgi:putative tricarboxylic transport membrane protein
MDWTIAFGPGGGNDVMARTIISILEEEELYPGELVPTNREGGSGATGYSHLFSQAGSGYGISTTSASYITTPLQADTVWGTEDFTPIGLLATDESIMTVMSDSPVQSWEDWVEYAKSNRVVVGGVGTVATPFITATMLAEQAGYEFEYVPFNDEGQLITALTSGALDAMAGEVGSIVGQVQAGEMRVLIQTADEPLSIISDVPTDVELGFEGIPSMPRGLVLPPDAPEEAQQWWIDTMQQVVETEAWQAYLEENFLAENLIWGEDFSTFLADIQEKFERILSEAGAL